MHQPVEQLAQVAERGGASVALVSGTIGWLSANYNAVAALSALGGLGIAIVGLLVSWYYKHQRHKRESKQLE